MTYNESSGTLNPAVPLILHYLNFLFYCGLSSVTAFFYSFEIEVKENYISMVVVFC